MSLSGHGKRIGDLQLLPGEQPGVRQDLHQNLFLGRQSPARSLVAVDDLIVQTDFEDPAVPFHELGLETEEFRDRCGQPGRTVGKPSFQAVADADFLALLWIHGLLLFSWRGTGEDSAQGLIRRSPLVIDHLDAAGLEPFLVEAPDPVANHLAHALPREKPANRPGILGRKRLNPRVQIAPPFSLEEKHLVTEPKTRGDPLAQKQNRNLFHLTPRCAGLPFTPRAS